MATFEDVDGVIAMDIRWTGEGLDGPVVEWPIGIALMIRGGLIALLVAGETGVDARARLREIQRNPAAS